MKHEDKIVRMKLTVDVRCPDGRMAEVEAEVDMRALGSYVALRASLDGQIDRFISQHYHPDGQPRVDNGRAVGSVSN